MEYSTLFNKSDYDILELLISDNCNSSFKSITKQEIMRETGFSDTKVRQAIKNFVLTGFISEGSKEGNSKTYFYLEKGKQHYMDILGYKDNDIKNLVENRKEYLDNREEDE